MRPFVKEGRDVMVIEPLREKPKKYDAVMFRRENVAEGRNAYVLHRVMEVSPGRVVLMGDGNLRGQEVCRPEDVLARADEVVDENGRHRRLDTPGQRRKAQFWRFLLPVRRWILAVYKRTIIRRIDIQ